MSRSSLEDGLSEPDQRPHRLHPLRSREERVEAWIPVVFFVGLVIGRDDVQDVVLDALSHLAATLDADEAGFRKPTPTCENVPNWDLFGFEHRLELRGSGTRDSKDNLRRLRLGPTLLPLGARRGLSVATAAASDRRFIRRRVRLDPRRGAFRSSRHTGASDRHYLTH